MAHVHITLVGGQPAPVYNGIVATMPDKIIFVHSPQSEEEMKRISTEVRIESEPLSVDPVDLSDIETKISACAKRLQDDEVSVNISGGTKPWAFYCAKIFSTLPQATLFYVDQNNVLWNLSDKSSTRIVFDMDAQLKLTGNRLEFFTSFPDYNDDDKKSFDSIVEARKYNCGSFNALTTTLSKDWEGKLKNQRKGRFSISEMEYVEWQKPDYVKLVLRTKKYGIRQFEIKSPHAVNLAFKTGWFEYKIARMISHWRYAKDIRLNCIFPLKNTNDVDHPKNEIDIIVNVGTKILFVECKTHIQNSTDIDKFRTAVKNYGGMGSKALFVTDNNMTDIQKEKCKESGIINFSLQDSSYGNDKELELFKLLENVLFNINTK